jgi:DNA-binding MarR family transcriptional regulator
MYRKKGELFTDLVLGIFKLGGLLVSEGNRLTAELGLTSARWKVLGAVALSNVPLTVPQIARTMGQTRQSVQRITDCMNQDGILIYKDNPAHKRAKLLTLTQKGMEIYAALESIQTPWANRIAEDINISELNTTLALIKRLIQRFESDPA